MHRLVVSEGVVLGKRGVGEANTVASVLTRDIGLIYARAASTRAEKSKLRFGIEPFTLARFSFIRGKHEWKLVGVEAISRELLSEEARSRSAAGRVGRLMQRLIHGEEHTTLLFEEVCAGLGALAKATREEELRSIECILVIRILLHLGYVGKNEALAPYLRSGEFGSELIAKASKARPMLIRAINESLSQTGL